MKSSKIIAFNDQYDVHLNHIYLCADLLGVQRHVHVEEDFGIVQEEITPTDKDSDITGESVVDSDRGLVMTMSIIAVIVLLVILYRVEQALTRKQPEESPRPNRPTDFVELNVINDRNNADHIRLNVNDVKNNTNTKFAEDDNTNDNIRGAHWPSG